MKARGEGITLYCAAHRGIQPCNTSWAPGWDQMIQYFGLDFEISAERARFLAMFECPNCGAPAYSLTFRPGMETPGMGGGYGYNHTPPLSIEEATRRYHEMEAERKRLGIKSNEEINAQARAKLKAQKRAQRRGEDFIGPPSPWAFRKKGRWL